MFTNKVILITGGTGSFGTKFCETIFLNYKQIKKLIIFSRDELKQFEMMNIYKDKPYYEKMRFFLGDVRDKERLDMALRDVNIVIHAAALKHVPSSEYNPFETIKTNVMGTQNVIESCIKNNVEKLITLSTDKASSPINLYGATKLLADKMTVAAENFKGKAKLVSSVVRYGNVLASRGSIVPILLKSKNKKKFKLTHKDMTRFNITLEEAINLVIFAIKNSKGGEIFVPKLPSYKLIDLASAIMPKTKISFSGIRPGEKIHEEMISFTESLNTIEFKNHYVILPSFKSNNMNSYIKRNGGKKTIKQFSYTSNNNKNFLNIKQIKKIISDLVVNDTL